MAIVIGVIGAFVAWFLLKLIGFFTNLFYYHRLSASFASPAGNHLGVYAIAVPVVGSLIVGLMARYGSERIRGHGIPEAIESILMNGSRVHPRLAILKPLSAAISIGSGGPFGAEGPIIMTGGAFGSMISQFFHFTSVERKTLLVAGASRRHVGNIRGSACFGADRRRAAAVRMEASQRYSRRAGERRGRRCQALFVRDRARCFPVPAHPAFIGLEGLAGCVVAGLAAGVLSALLTLGVYAAEDLFRSCRFTGCGGLRLAACSLAWAA